MDIARRTKLRTDADALLQPMLCTHANSEHGACADCQGSGWSVGSQLELQLAKVLSECVALCDDLLKIELEEGTLRMDQPPYTAARLIADLRQLDPNASIYISGSALGHRVRAHGVGIWRGLSRHEGTIV
jgi:hypothetical protein